MLASDRYKWLSVFLVPVIILCCPTAELFTPMMRSMSAVTMFGILMLGFSLVDTTIASFLLMVGYLIIGIPQEAVFFAWLTDIPWLVLCALVLVVIVGRTSLLDKMAYWALSRVGTSYMAIMLVITTIAIITRLLLQSTVGCVLVLTLAYGLCVALKYEGRSAGGLLCMSMIAYKDGNFFIYSPDYMAILYEAGRELANITPSYSEFFMNNAVFIVSLYATAVGVSMVCKPATMLPARSFFREKFESLGSTSVDEKKILGVLFLLLIYLFSSSWHNLPMLWGFMIAPCLLYMPGINVGTSKDLAQVNYGAILFIVGCMSIGGAVMATGSGKILADSLLPSLGEMSAPMFLFVSYVMMVLLNFVMTPLAELAAFAHPVTEVAMDLGFNLHAVYNAVYQGTAQVLLPYESATYLLCFSFGLFKIKDFVIIFTAKLLIQTLVLVTLGFGWWKFIGLI